MLGNRISASRGTVEKYRPAPAANGRQGNQDEKKKDSIDRRNSGSMRANLAGVETGQARDRAILYESRNFTDGGPGLLPRTAAYQSEPTPSAAAGNEFRFI